MCKLRDSSCLGILSGSIFRTDLVICLKSGWNQFIFPNWAEKRQNFPKSIFRELLIVENWPFKMTAMGVLWCTYPSDNRKCPKNTFLFVFLGALQLRNCMIFHIRWATDRIKLVGPSKWLQEWIYYEYCTIHIPLRQPERLKKVAFLLFFFGPYSIKFQKVPYHKNYISY